MTSVEAYRNYRLAPTYQSGSQIIHSYCSQHSAHWCVQVKTKRKVGRPIAYQGDPDSPDLDPEQRQIILRRIANRR